jgi:hypothetical protein
MRLQVRIPDRGLVVSQGQFLARPEGEIREALALGETWLVELDDPVEFLARLQAGFRPPMQGNPHSGLPPSVWVGARWGAGDQRGNALMNLLEVRAAVRWVDVDGPSLDPDVAQAWRCSNCGTRGFAPRPTLCPHAGGLCGDAALYPQVHVVMSDTLSDSESRVLDGLGISVWPSLRTFGFRRL